MDRELHTIPPIYDKECRVLILGSFPSQKSREAAFFYAHPQNRFWRVIASVTDSDKPPVSDVEKRDLLLANNIALWDVIGSCTLTGSSDSSIKDVIPNDIGMILNAAPIYAVFCNGQTAFTYYKRLILPKTGMVAAALPSTSPANAAWSLERLTETWRGALKSHIRGANKIY